jgi:recombination protein RecA
LLDLAVEYNLIGKSGAWFSYGDERIGQGRDNAKTYLQENAAVAAVIETQVRQALGMPQAGSEALAISAQAASMETDAADLFDDQDLEPDLLVQEED